ncbi:MAG: hypothetical protein IAG10_03495, partial [Planctomycetaceae bacterium]|nr:hypothetical protein [Planctomycetaceae bacterium]
MQPTTWRTNVGTCLAACGLSVLTGFESEFLDRHSRLFAAEDSAKVAATVEETIKVLDLRTFTLPEGAVVESSRTVGEVSYETKADPKKAFQIQQQQFVKLGWKELPGSMAEAEYGTGQFQKSNYVVSVSTTNSGKPGVSRVSIFNMGNVRASKLPVVKGAKSLFANETSAMYSTDMKLADAIETTRKLLIDAGWEPYGEAGNTTENMQLMFKRNAIQISAFIGVAPAQGGKTSIQMSTLQLSADIPAPANAKQLNYTDMHKTLRFESSDKYDNIAKFYQQSLAKKGWKPTTENLITASDNFKRQTGMQVFRNAAKDIITLDLEPQLDHALVKVSHLTAEEYAEVERKAKEAAQKLVAEREKAATKSAAKKPMPADGTPSFEDLANQAIANALNGKDAKAAKGSKDKVGIPIPEKAKKVSQTGDNVLQIKVAAGKGQAAAEFIRDQLVAADWKVDDDADIDDTSGNVTFKKGSQQITLTFVDTKLADVNLMVIGIGAKLEPSKADPNAKPADKKPEPKPESKPDPESKPSKKTASKKPKAEDGDEPIVEPKRKEKSKQGIAKLPKLPSEGTVTMDDKPFKLTNVIAYEIISNGQWRTKIVATEKPIKQEALLAMLKKTGNDERFDLPQPYLKVELDDEDRPASLGLSAAGTPGGATSGKLKGEALVEDGRARGTVKLNEPGKFFDKVYTGEISFDVPVLTRDSTASKRLTDAPKLANSGKLTLGATTYKLANVVAYEVKVFDEKRTGLFFSEKPINLDKLKASLKKDGTDDGLFEFQPQVRLQIDSSDAVKQMHLWADNTSVSSNADITGDFVIEDGRARGTAKLSKPGEFFGKAYTFEV